MLLLAVRYNIDSDIYQFLNSILRGKILLQKYKLNNTLDMTELKDLIIWHEIEKDPINYK